MLALRCSSIPAIPGNPKSITRNFPNPNPTPQSHYRLLISRKPSPIQFVTLANNSDNEQVTAEPDSSLFSDDKNGDGGGKDRRPPPFDIKWTDLLNPDADNVLAIGLTGLLTWASVQVLWQLLFISLAILVAAVKYSLIAALLLFILITLL